MPNIMEENSHRPKGRLRNLPSRLHRYSSSLTKRKTKPTCDNIPALHVYPFNYFLLYTKSFLLKPSRLPETNNDLPACQSRTTNPATTSDEATTLLSLTFQSTELPPRPHGRTPLWQKVGRTSIALVQSYHQRYHAEHCRNTNQMALLP